MLGKNNYKLVPAETEKDIAAAKIWFNGFADPNDKLVAFAVAISVIDRFEGIDIKHTSDERRIVALWISDQVR